MSLALSMRALAWSTEAPSLISAAVIAGTPAAVQRVAISAASDDTEALVLAAAASRAAFTSASVCVLSLTGSLPAGAFAMGVSLRRGGATWVCRDGALCALSTHARQPGRRGAPADADTFGN